MTMTELFLLKIYPFALKLTNSNKGFCFTKLFPGYLIFYLNPQVKAMGYYDTDYKVLDVHSSPPKFRSINILLYDTTMQGQLKLQFPLKHAMLQHGTQMTSGYVIVNDGWRNSK